ncbi:MAG: hypothetical protein HY505_00445 [Candidatus Yanofskybacteria bacterium]|nr:hypothetical protein [Candidatus Yanofskybacteria bacterium]
MTAIITREQAVRIVGNEKEFKHRMLGHSDELARLMGGTVKLFSKGRLGPSPIFELRSMTCDNNEEDIQEIIEALERGESGLLCNSRMGC